MVNLVPRHTLSTCQLTEHVGMNNYVKTYLRIGFSWARKWKPGYLEIHGTQPSHWYSVAPGHKEQQSPLLFWAESIYHFPEVSEQKETCTSGASLVPML